jgi:hypothetical protein
MDYELEIMNEQDNIKKQFILILNFSLNSY